MTALNPLAPAWVPSEQCVRHLSYVSEYPPIGETPATRSSGRLRPHTTDTCSYAAVAAVVSKDKTAEHVDEKRLDGEWYETRKWSIHEDVHSDRESVEAIDTDTVEVTSAEAICLSEVESTVPCVLHITRPHEKAVSQLKTKWAQMARRKRIEMESDACNTKSTQHVVDSSHESYIGWHRVLAPGVHTMTYGQCYGEGACDLRRDRQNSKSSSAESDEPPDNETKCDLSEWWTALRGDKFQEVERMISCGWTEWSSAVLTEEGGGGGMHLAAQLGHTECLLVLIGNGASLESRDREKKTPLLIACENGHVECVRALLDAGASIQARDKHSNSALHLSVGSKRNGALSVVEFLCRQCSRGLKINCRNRKRETPLMAAAGLGLREVVVCILRAGGDPFAVNLCGDDALCIAARRGACDILEALLSCNTQRRGQVGREPESERRKSPLMETVRSGNTACARLLLSFGADPNELVISARGMSPMMRACKDGNIRMVHTLLDGMSSCSRNHLNLTDAFGMTALGYSCIGGSRECTKALIAFSPDCVNFTYRYFDNETVLEAVSRFAHQETLPTERLQCCRCIPLILQAGAVVSSRFLRRMCRYSERNWMVGDDKGRSTDITTTVAAPVPAPWSTVKLQLADVSILCEDTTLECHAFILSLHSDCLRAMLYSNLVETRPDGGIVVRFPHYAGSTMKRMLHWMYTGTDVTLEAELQDVVDLIMLSNELLVTRLQRLCEHTMGRWCMELSADTESAIVIRDVAAALNLTHLLGYFAVESDDVESNTKERLLSVCDIDDENLEGRATVSEAIKGNCMGYSKTKTSANVPDRAFLSYIFSKRLPAIVSSDSLQQIMQFVRVCLSKATATTLCTLLFKAYSSAPSTPLPFSTLVEYYHIDMSYPECMKAIVQLLQFSFPSLYEFSRFAFTNVINTLSSVSRVTTGDMWSLPQDFVSDEMYMLLTGHVLLTEFVHYSCDMTILCAGGVVHKAHKAVVANGSAKFESLLRLRLQAGNWNGTLVLEDATGQLMGWMLHFLYLGYLPPIDLDGSEGSNLEALLDLVYMSDEYLVPNMKQRIESDLVGRLTSSNCIEIFQVANAINAPHLCREAALAIIRDYPWSLGHNSAENDKDCIDDFVEQVLRTLMTV